MDSISTIETIGRISVPLAVNYNATQGLFSPALAAPNSPVLIQMVTDALQWSIDGGAQTEAEQRAIGNYLLWLCGRFGIQARNSINPGGGVVPVTPGGSPNPYTFYVDASTSFIINGQSSATITAFIGFNLIFNRNGLPQSTLTSEPTYYTWNKTTGLFTCSPAAITSELFQLIPA